MKKSALLLVLVFVFSTNVYLFNFGAKANLSSQNSFLYGTVYKCNTLNVRKSEWGKVIGSVYRGNLVTIKGTSRDSYWYIIEFRGNTAFVSHKHVKISNSPTSTSNSSGTPTTNSSTSNKIGFTTATTLNVRRAPWGSVLDRLKMHSKVNVTGKKGEWYKIMHGSGSAYVHSKWVTFSLGTTTNTSSQATTASGTSTPNLGNGKVVGKANGSGYYPHNSRMEGGYNDMKGKPLCTLQDYLAGKVPYVSIALDQYLYRGTIRYGDKFRIPELEKKYGRKIEFRAVDCGGAFKWKGFSKVDICTGSKSDSYEKTLNGTLTLVKV